MQATVIQHHHWLKIASKVLPGKKAQSPHSSEDTSISSYPVPKISEIMPRGGCLCSKIRIAYDGEPNAKVICHCTDCRKISGSTYGAYILIPADRFFVTAGDVRIYHKPADSGRILTSHFCGDCGTTLYQTCNEDPSAFGGAVIVRLGVLDGEQRAALDDAQPTAELFVGQRVGWVAPIEGAEQRVGMR